MLDPFFIQFYSEATLPSYYSAWLLQNDILIRSPFPSGIGASVA